MEEKVNEEHTEKEASKGDAKRSRNTEKIVNFTNENILPIANDKKPSDYCDAHTVPFYLKWIFGLDIATLIQNLTRSKKERYVYYTVAHIGIVLDYQHNTMRFLMGHKNYITSTSKDGDGSYLVSADNGESDNTVIIWDRNLCIPVSTIFDPHGKKYGVVKVGMSDNAKYVVTVGSEPQQIIKFWSWSYGRDTEDGAVVVKEQHGKTIQISFNENKQEHFMVTFESQVIFCYWDEVECKLIATTPDEIRGKKTKNYGDFTSSIYIYKSHRCVTSTSNGWVLIWANTYYTRNFLDAPINNNKFFIKAIKLQSKCITAMCMVDGYIATGDVEGNVKFYDTKIQLLYWCQNFKLPAIAAIRFHLCQRNYVFKDPFSMDSVSDRNSDPIEDEIEEGEEDEDRSAEFEKVYAELMPSDYTLQREPFIVRDFVIVTTDGRIGYVDFVENTYKVLYDKCDSSILCLDVHDEKPILVLGYKSGRVCIYNYEQNTFILGQHIKSSKDEDYNSISSVKFSPQAYHLACGTSGGHIWFLDTAILAIKYKKPFKYETSKVNKICFSDNNKYLAYYDSAMAVCLLKYNKNIEEPELQWEFYGRYIAHYKRITDMMFMQGSRLLTIGEDRRIVEYDVVGSQPQKLDVLYGERVQQTAIPQCFIFNDFQDPEQNCFIIATNEYKFQEVNEVTKICTKTILAPTLGAAIYKMQLVPGKPKYMVFCTNHHIGIHLLPANGSPFKYVALIANPNKIIDFVMSHDGQYVFTIGEHDHTCIMWKTKTSSVDVMSRRGGKELDPFYCLIEGGQQGWLFQEMQDLFYYMQILEQGENTPLPRKTSNKIPIAELPSLMRAIGFYPTEYDLDNMLYEVKYSQSKNQFKELITFEDFVKLYINHRPTFGVSIDKLKHAFERFTKKGKIKRNKFVDMLCQGGEHFTESSLDYCLHVLMNHENAQNDDLTRAKDFLRENITFDYLVDDILGIDMSKTMEEKTNKTTD